MSRLKQLFQKLHYDKIGGLFYLENKDEWIDKFPYRISRILSEVIKPYAFLSLFHVNGADNQLASINSPFILFFDDPQEDKWEDIQKAVFSFGMAIFAVVNREHSGTLDIYHGYSLDKTVNVVKQLEKLSLDDDCLGIENFFQQELWKKNIEPFFSKAQKNIDEYLLKNIIDARRILTAKDGLKLPPRIANRLIGRLLFIRYLIDRKVCLTGQLLVPNGDKDFRRKEFTKLILDKEKLYDFFIYLTNHFEGELFPILKEERLNEIELVSLEHLEVLYHLFNCSEFFHAGTEYKDYMVQPSLFDTYDFEVIPVEFISNVYQNFIGADNIENQNITLKALSKQKELKAYYTPPFLVDFVLSQTVEKQLSSSNIASCKTLDPACGSGIFLVETLRKLIEKKLKLSRDPHLGIDILWKLVKENIFGFDLDEDAVEITIFSIYITLLDYKTPKEIETFKFQKLRGENLFGGKAADFFNVSHPFNKKSSFKYFDCIIGNPPWGLVKMSSYLEYISDRDKQESSNDNYCPLTLGRNEISQAFMIRASDFSTTETKIAFIVTGKNFYNREEPFKNWRNYFLNKFKLAQFVDLTSLNHKAAGGRQIFTGARQSTVIVFYSKSEEKNFSSSLRHITIKYNRFYEALGTLIIEKNDIKNIQQKYFMPEYGGEDWLWRVLVHGNIHDYHFMKRLLSTYPPLNEYLQEHNFIWHGGYKRKDESVKKAIDTKKYKNFLHVDAKNDFTSQFVVSPQDNWNTVCNDYLETMSEDTMDNDGKKYLCDQFPAPQFLTGKKLLIKKGVQAENFYPITCCHEGNILFSSTVCSIVEKNHSDSEALDYISGVIFDELFAYYLLNMSSSAGVDRNRLSFNEYFDFPVPNKLDKKLSKLSKKLHDIKKEGLLPIDFFRTADIEEELKHMRQKLKEIVYEVYSLTPKEKALIDYAQKIALPIFKRKLDGGIFTPLKINDAKEFLSDYLNVFIEHFSLKLKNGYFGAEVTVSSWFIGVHFKIFKTKPHETISIVNNDYNQLLQILGFAGIYEISPQLMVQQDIRGFLKDSFYIIKPNEKKCWHEAVAYLDLEEFVTAIMKSELKLRKNRICNDCR